MAIPISYNFRNLVERRTTTLMTALGIALTVSVLLAVLALVNGLKTAFAASGNPLHVLVLRKGSTSELVSNLSRQQYNDLKFKSGIARDRNGDPMVSLEMVTVINLASIDAPDGANVTLRGLTLPGAAMRDEVKLSSGRWFQPGRREVVAGSSIARRYPGARLGGTLQFGRGSSTVVGVMEGGRSAVNSEIWGDLNQISTDYNRTEVLSSALVRASDPVTVTALINDLESDTRLNVAARTERDYYASQTISAAPVQFLGIFVSMIMAVGSCFAAMNTRYAAVARRAREIGTLRVLGFSKSAILLSFFLESLLLSALGGLLGCALVLPLNNITTGIGSFVTFSEIAFNFRVGPETMAVGVAFALLMGALGGLFPAGNAARKEILTALREI
jgi:putative ABC transport system permease protein